MIHEDVIVYAAPDGLHYVANFSDMGWRRWPAVGDGWSKRANCSAGLVDRCTEMTPKLGDLALRLSGVSYAPSHR